MAKHYSAVNIQWPITELILNGSKTIETRTYPLPKKYIGEELVLIETPGPMGNFTARGIAIITFGASYQYSSRRHFNSEIRLHRVSQNSKWKWLEEKPKWAWPILKIKKIKSAVIPKHKGIRFTNNVKVPKQK